MPIELGSFSLGTIAGGVIVGVFNHYLTKSRSTEERRIREFNQAAAAFRSKVLAGLEGLYPIPTNWPTKTMMIDRILREKFPKIQAAVAEFRPFLRAKEQVAFDEAWFVYRLGKDGREIDKQCYFDYMPFVSTAIEGGIQVTVDTTTNYKETFKHNVDCLLKFAEHT